MSSTNVNAERSNYLFLRTEVLTMWGFSENSPGADMYLICEALRIYPGELPSLVPRVDYSYWLKVMVHNWVYTNTVHLLIMHMIVVYKSYNA
jgi:hypothetical protein